MVAPYSCSRIASNPPISSKVCTLKRAIWSESSSAYPACYAKCLPLMSLFVHVVLPSPTSPHLLPIYCRPGCQGTGAHLPLCVDTRDCSKSGGSWWQLIGARRPVRGRDGMVDIWHLKCLGRKPVPVRVRPPAPARIARLPAPESRTPHRRPQIGWRQFRASRNLASASMIGGNCGVDTPCLRPDTRNKGDGRCAAHSVETSTRK